MGVAAHNRGVDRSSYNRSARTNDPLALPRGLSGLTAEARRWRDLVRSYSDQLGERMRREDVRVLVGSLVSLSLISERLNDEVARGETVDPNHVIQVAQTIMRLLAELDIKPAARDTPPDLKAHIARRTGAEDP